MQTKTETKTSLDNLLHLPAFAQYLLAHKLDEMAEVQLRISSEIDLPIVGFFKNHPLREKLTIVKQSLADLLTCLSQNQARQQIESTLHKWKSNQFPVFSKNDIVAHDITLITYVRKKSFLYFLPDYCSATAQMIELIKEIDLFLLESETYLTDFYFNLLKERISERSHLIEKITNTSPGIIYVYDVINNKELYANRATTDFLGYSPEEITAMGNKFVETLIHPNDLAMLRQYEDAFRTTKDGEIRSFEYRIQNINGEYRWLRTYETVFKRNEQGTISEKIGIAIDIHKQKITADQLHKREAELLEAQEIAQLGSFTWNFENKTWQGSPQTNKILEIELSDMQAFLNHVYPDDKKNVEQAMATALETGKFEREFRYIGEKDEKTIWARGIVNFHNGKPQSLHGTLMDVTERQKLIQQLQENELLYQQAQALTHIGNYTWDLATNEIKWSNELYRIYGLEPQSISTNFDVIEKFNHPDDIELVRRKIKTALDEKKPFDFYYRIYTPQGALKILHARGTIFTNGKERPVTAIGTAQDVTEIQTLLTQLSHNEKVYKQAEELANMGNWSWDMKNNKLQWTDHLYKIYGLQPQAEEMTTAKFLSFVHPDDRAYVEEGIENMYKEKDLDYTFRIITATGQEKILRSIAHVETDEKGNPILVVGTEQDITEKQHLIETLKKSEALYKQAQSLANLGNWTLDLKTMQQTWSDEMYSIYEVPLGTKVTIRDWKEHIHPDDKEYIVNYLNRCIQNKQPYDKMHRVVLANGKIKTLHRKGELIFDKDGQPVKMIGTTQDVTEQQRVQQILRENQTFIQKITDATPSIIASYNVNTGRYVFISEGLEKMLGYNTKEVMQKGIQFFMDIIHPDDLPSLLEKNEKTLQQANDHPGKNDLVSELTYRMRHKNGAYRWFHTYGTIFDRNSEGKVEHVLNISLDITEQQEATKKIAEQEHFIQQIAEASPTILYLFDVDQQSIVYINREIFFVLRYLPDEIIAAGETITELLYHPDDYHLLPARKQSSKSFQQVDSMIQYECRLKSKDGDWCWFLVREIVFKTNKEGKIKQILGAALDITRRKEMEKTILQNTLQLQQSNASLEEFAYVASHDLKEPLRKISTFGDRLVATQMDKLTPEGNIYLKKIVDASQRMQTMISDLLSISMISGNRQFEMYSLQKILEETLQTLEHKIEQQNAIIKYDELPEAHIIPSQFRQLFQNLLSNSLKFVRENVQPVITITYSLAREKEIVHYQLVPAAHYHKIEFADNGIGFENEFAGKIFAIFQRLHGRSEYEGSGIGLAICKKIVEHHGGIIYATSIPNEEARFTIILPA